jgi:flagellar basal body-associated protein FliL
MKKVALVVLILVLVAGGGLFAAYTYYGDEILPELPGAVSEALDKVTETTDRITGILGKEPPSRAAAAASKKLAKPAGDGGAKNVKDVLGGPEFSDAKASIQQVALRGGAPEQPVRASLPEQMAKPDAAPSPMQVLPPLPPPNQLMSSNKQALQPLPPPNQLMSSNKQALQPLPPPNQLMSSKKQGLQPLLSADQLMSSKKQGLQPLLSADQLMSSNKQVLQPPPQPPPPPPPRPRATLLLSNVNGRLSDRADLTVNMSIELTYESNSALREELEFKRDMLITVASSVLRRHEYGSVSTSALKAEMLTVFNGHLQAGKLSDVEITDFQVGQVAAK